MDKVEDTNATPDVGTDKSSIAGELSDLGLNLIGVLQAAWDRPERQKLQQEIESGLKELGSALRKETEVVSNSKVSQRVKTEVNDINYRVRSAEVDVKVREELVGALKAINFELAKVTMILSTSGRSPTGDETQGTPDIETVTTAAVVDTSGEPSTSFEKTTVQAMLDTPADDKQSDNDNQDVIEMPQED
jgi:hypothetical protein